MKKASTLFSSIGNVKVSSLNLSHRVNIIQYYITSNIFTVFFDWKLSTPEMECNGWLDQIFQYLDKFIVQCFMDFWYFVVTTIFAIILMVYINIQDKLDDQEEMERKLYNGKRPSAHLYKKRMVN